MVEGLRRRMVSGGEASSSVAVMRAVERLGSAVVEAWFSSSITILVVSLRGLSGAEATIVGGTAAAAPGLASLMVLTVEGTSAVGSRGTMMAPVGRLRRMVLGPADGAVVPPAEIGAVDRLVPAGEGGSMSSRIIREVARLPGSVRPRSTTRVVLFLAVELGDEATTVSADAISGGTRETLPVLGFWTGGKSESESTIRVVLFRAASSSMSDSGLTRPTPVGGLGLLPEGGGISSAMRAVLSLEAASTVAGVMRVGGRRGVGPSADRAEDWPGRPSSTMRAVAFLDASSRVWEGAGEKGADGAPPGLARRIVCGWAPDAGSCGTRRTPEGRLS